MCICRWCSRPTPGYKTKQTERVTVCVSILLPESQFYLSIAVKRLNRRRDLQLGNLSRHKNRHFWPSIRLNVVYWWWILIGGWNKENKNKTKKKLKQPCILIQPSTRDASSCGCCGVACCNFGSFHEVKRLKHIFIL